MTLKITKTQIAGFLCIVLAFVNPEQYVGNLWIPGVTVTAPVAEEGFRGFILEESGAREKYTPSQREIVLSTAPGTVRDYFNTHAVKVGTNPEFRLIDKDNTDLSRESLVWGKYFAKALTDAKQPDGSLNLPWLVYGDGKSGKSMAITPDLKPADLLAELAKVGGK
jgi:hypothetical protein